MNCEIVMDMAELYLEQLLRTESRTEIQRHLKTCPDCRRYYHEKKKAKPISEQAWIPGNAPSEEETKASAQRQYETLSRKLRRRRNLGIAGTSAAIGAGSVMLAIGIMMMCRVYPFRLTTQK